MWDNNTAFAKLNNNFEIPRGSESRSKIICGEEYPVITEMEVFTLSGLQKIEREIQIEPFKQKKEKKKSKKKKR